jgi:beta-aspartyl-peptidase (threonine type)
MCANSGTVTALVFLVATPLAPTFIHAEEEEAKSIRAVLDAQAVAWNKGDLDGFMAGYWNDEKLTFISGGDITRGWKQTKVRYEKRYKSEGKEMGTLTFSELELDVLSPTAAVVRGKFRLVFDKEKDEKKKTPQGRFTLICKKFPDGWKIVHDHTSAAEMK